VRNVKNLVKKYKWIAMGIVAAVVGAAVFLCINYYQRKNNAAFYEVKCLFSREDANYSLIVDDKKAAKAFKKEMEQAENANDRADFCEFISYPNAANQTLFVYSVMAVLKDVRFAFQDEIISRNIYQVQYFSDDDSVVALSCDYAGVRFDCYNEMPAESLCPDTLEDAEKLLADKCYLVNKEQ
jgi:hypothetical protein